MPGETGFIRSVTCIELSFIFKSFIHALGHLLLKGRANVRGEGERMKSETGCILIIIEFSFLDRNGEMYLIRFGSATSISSREGI